jgi:hypothetical protein
MKSVTHSVTIKRKKERERKKKKSPEREKQSCGGGVRDERDSSL